MMLDRREWRKASQMGFDIKRRVIQKVENGILTNVCTARCAPTEVLIIKVCAQRSYNIVYSLCMTCIYIFENRITLKTNSPYIRQNLPFLYTSFCWILISANLRRHMESTHAKQITRSCHICGRTFSSDTAVLKHIRVHTGEKPYACEFCSKKFSRLDKMKEHKNIHLGLKLHGCNLCEKRYTQRCNLKVHMLSVHVSWIHFIL